MPASSSSISPSLPPETWINIFSLVVHEPGLLDTKWDYPPDQLIWQGVWLEKRMEWKSIQLRTNIVLVSREWRDLGRRFLYEDLAVDNRRKVRDLVTHFEQSVSVESGGVDADTTSFGYGRWVKRFSVYSGYLFEEDISSDLERLLRLCPNVLTVLLYTETVLEDSYKPSMSRLLWSPPSLRRISLEPLGNGLKESREIFSHSHPPLHLDWVALPSNWMVEIFPSIGDSPSPAPISLSNISVLEIDIIHPVVANLPAWDLPSLRYLSFDNVRNAEILSLLPFIAQNGPRLLGLSLRTTGDSSNLPKLLEHTPSIQSLVCDGWALESTCDPNSAMCPNVTHIGIVGITYPSLESIRSVTDGLNYILQHDNLFPSLLTVRILIEDMDPPPTDGWNDAITAAAQYGVRLEDYQRRLLSVQQVEEEPEE